MERIAFLSIGPEIILLGAAVTVLMLAVTVKLGSWSWAAVAFFGLVCSVFLSVVQWFRVDDFAEQAMGVSELPIILNYGGASRASSMVVMDHFSSFAGFIIFAIGTLALLSAWPLVKSLEQRGAEFVALALLAITGLHVMTLANNLLLLFIGLETASIALYVIAGFVREEPNSDEAAMKYFLLGSFASAIFLYGIALTFAATGSTFIYGGIEVFVNGQLLNLMVNGNDSVLLAGIALLIVGLGFKVSAAPFHQWAPDVYEGAAGGAVGLMATGVKVAGFAAMARILVGAFPLALPLWAPAIAAVAALSVIIGTAFAVAQTDFKRLLGYSGVAHAGFLLTALVAAEGGVAGMWFYVATYAFTLLGAFTIAAVVSGSRSGGSSLDEYRGLATRSPVLALVLAVFLLSLAGFPLTAGFVGKVAVFSSAIASGYLWLVIVGLTAAVAGLYFYLRVIVLMYFVEPALVRNPGTAVADPKASGQQQLTLSVALVVTVVFGVVPWPLLNLAKYAVPS